MKNVLKRVGALIMTAIMIVSTNVAFVFAANAEPPEITECGPYVSGDFDIKFGNGYDSYLNAITGVSVGGVDYEKTKLAFDILGATKYYVHDNYVLIGEGGIGDTGKAECVITADGYKDLVLELDKNAHTATVKDSSTEPDAHEHTGGTATCKEKAICSICGKEYGEYGDHDYKNGVCTVCGANDPSAAKKTPAEILSSGTTLNRYDFVITFISGSSDYVSAITGITVDGKAYTLASSSYGVWNNSA